jgi:hypothetical protein
MELTRSRPRDGTTSSEGFHYRVRDRRMEELSVWVLKEGEAVPGHLLWNEGASPASCRSPGGGHGMRVWYHGA